MTSIYQKIGLFLFPLVFGIGNIFGLTQTAPIVHPSPASSSVHATSSVPVPTSKSNPQATTTSTKKTSTKLPTLALTVPKFNPIKTSPDDASSTTSLPVIPLSSFITPIISTTTTSVLTSSSTIESQIPEQGPNGNDQIYTDAHAVVNIFCLVKVGASSIASITGTGVVVNSTGVILTNAHVTEHVLISDYSSPDKSACEIRTGSPAASTYDVSTLYISPKWVEAHYMDNNLDNPQESGQDDYAFLQIGSEVDGVSKPQLLPYIIADTTDTLSRGDSVLLMGYPSGSLDADTVRTDLRLEADRPTITSIYNFSNNGNVDIVKTSATAVAQKGSSGGALINNQNKLAGLMTTILSDPNSSVLNDIQAITLPYISNDLKANTGYDLETFLTTPSLLGTQFTQNQKPTLANLLISNSQ